jgi:carbonic anhydrase
MRNTTRISLRVPGSVTLVVILSAGACSAPAERPQPPAPPVGAQAPATRPSAAPATADPAWHYEGDEGPAVWGKLSPKFAACGDGRAQSPIDIANPAPGKGAPELKLVFPKAELKIAHHAHVADAINSGHTIQINYAGADTLTIGNDTYALVQYHFHNPSEHTMKGKHAPMEMHLVHQSATGSLAVVGVLVEEGAHNRAFDPIWANLPKEKGVEIHYPAVAVDVDALLPSVRTSYRYDGSLTTPPCSEGVKWILMAAPIHLSAQQIGAFTQVIHDNNRPTQPLNGRRVVTDAIGIKLP